MTDIYPISIEAALPDKDQVAEVDLQSAVELAFTQKPSSYAVEKEWRIAVLLSGDKDGAPPYLNATIPIGQRLGIRQFSVRSLARP